MNTTILKIATKAFCLIILISSIHSCKTDYYEYESICMDNPTTDTLIVIIDKTYGFRIDPLMTIVNFELPKGAHTAEVMNTSRKVIKKIKFTLSKTFLTDLFINIAGQEYIEWQVLYAKKAPNYIQTKSTTIKIDGKEYTGDLTYIPGTLDTFLLTSYCCDIDDCNSLPFKSLPEASEASVIKKLYRKQDFINDWNYKQIDTTNEAGQLLVIQREKLIIFSNALQKFKTSYKNILEDDNTGNLNEFTSIRTIIQTYLPQWEKEKEKIDVAALLKIFAEHENYFITQPLLKEDYNKMKIAGNNYIQFSDSLPNNIALKAQHTNGRVIEYDTYSKETHLTPKFEYIFENGVLKSKEEYYFMGSPLKKRKYSFPIVLKK